MKRTGVIISCEHARCHVPSGYQALFVKAQRALQSHRGYDIGALETARVFQCALRAPLIASRVTRLLADCNRNEQNPALWSPYSRSLDQTEQSAILDLYYRPYRQSVIDAVAQRVKRHGHAFHLSVHSFTPRLGRQVRHFDIGLLYDPCRKPERQFALKWRRALREHPLRLRVRCNAPYKGISDGMIPALRKQFPARNYTGIEIEINQRHALGPRRQWLALQKALVATFISIAT